MLPAKYIDINDYKIFKFTFTSAMISLKSCEFFNNALFKDLVDV